MFYVFYGSDVKKVADKTNDIVRKLLYKKPDAQVFSFEGDFLDETKLDEVIESQGLFVEKHIVVLKQVFETEENREIITSRLKRIADTGNIFIFSENKLLAPHKKKLEKYAEKIEEHKETKKEEKFNTFVLTDYLGKKDKKNLWIEYIKALKKDIPTESIQGMLHWGIRAMIIASNAKNANDAGQAPFAYSKNKRYAGNFTKDELLKLSRSLISVYHDARRGKHELKTALEKWILEI